MKVYPIKDVFCTTPYSMIVVNPDGSYRLCCLTNSVRHDLGASIDPKTGQEMNVWTHSFAEAMNGKWHLEMRKAHMAGTRTDQCSCCYDRDDINGNSRRRYVTTELKRVIPDLVHPEDMPKVMDMETAELKVAPISLDLRFSNLCNLKCYHCGPWYSDKWYQEFGEFFQLDDFGWNGKRIKINEATKGRLGANKDGELWWESKIWWERFEEIAPNLRHLYITGGEPMLVPAHEEILQRLVDRGFAKNVTIEIDTNLTTRNHRVMALWSKFKHVDLRISVDAVNELYEVARFPSSWTKFSGNLRNLQEVRSPNMRVWLTACISPLTVFHIQDIEDFNDVIGLGRAVHYRFIDGPEYLAIQLMTKRQKQFIIDYHTENPCSYSQKLIDYLRIHWDRTDVDNMRTFAKFMDYLDTTRGTNWRSLSPLSAELFTEHMLEIT